MVHRITPQDLKRSWVGTVLGGTCVFPEKNDDESRVSFLLTGRDHLNRSQIGSFSLETGGKPFVLNVAGQIHIGGPETKLQAAVRGLSYPHILRRCGQSIEMLAVGWSENENVYRNDLIYLRFTDQFKLLQATCVSEETEYGIGSTCILDNSHDEEAGYEYQLLCTTFRDHGLKNPIYDIASYTLSIDGAGFQFQLSRSDIAPKPTYRSVSYPAFDPAREILLVSVRETRYQTLAYHYREGSFDPIRVDGPLGDLNVQYASMFSAANRDYVIASLGRYGDAGLGIFEVEIC